MEITVEIPEDIARALADSRVSANRAALEGLTAEGYRSGALSELQVMRLLGLSTRFAVHEWLRARQIPLHYNESDLANDLETLSDLGLR